MGSSLVTLTVGSLQRRQLKKISKQLSDIEEISNFNFKSWVRQQTAPSSQLAVTIPAIDAAWNPEKLITNPVEYIHKKQKHVALVGGTGDGKSTFTQYLSSKIGGRVIVYDSDAKPDDWKWLSNDDVIGRKGDFKAINQGMNDDLSTLEELVQLRGNGGDSAIQGRDRFLIAEEFPILVDECDSASKWLKKHAKRGRRYKQFILAIAQNDSAENFGLQNDKGTLYSCFCLVRLGQFGIDYARTKLKDDQLVQWLKLGGKKRFLIDDYPCELDLSNWGINQLLPSSEATTLEPDNELKTDLNEYELAIIEAAKQLNGDALKARIVKQKSRLFSDMSSEDIRLMFQTLADREIGETEGEGDRMGYVYK